MPDSRKFIVAISIVIGGVLFLLGTASTGFYVYSVVDVLHKADQSVIFWYLVFVAIGIALVAMGIYFIWIGHKSSKEKSYAVLTKYSFGVFGAIFFGLILSEALSDWAANKTRSESIQQDEMRKSLAAEMHQVELIEIDDFDQTGFSFTVHISEGAKGSYRLKTSISDRQAVFLEEAEEIEFEGSKTKVSRFISFEHLFQKCFDEFQGSTVFVCIENTGANSFLTLESQLIPIKDKPQTITNIRNNVSLTSVGKTEFFLDTFTKDMKVKVNDLRPLNR